MMRVFVVSALFAAVVGFGMPGIYCDGYEGAVAYGISPDPPPSPPDPPDPPPPPPNRTV